MAFANSLWTRSVGWPESGRKLSKGTYNAGRQLTVPKEPRRISAGAKAMYQPSAQARRSCGLKNQHAPCCVGESKLGRRVQHGVEERVRVEGHHRRVCCFTSVQSGGEEGDGRAGIGGLERGDVLREDRVKLVEVLFQRCGLDRIPYRAGSAILCRNVDE
jgi:hypothetical protein